MDLLTARLLKWANWVILALLATLAYLWRGPQVALGVVVGGLVVVVNFHWLHRNLRDLLEKAPQLPEKGQGRAKAWFAAKQLLRFVVVLAVIYVLIRYGWVNLLGLVVGLSTVVLTLILAGLVEVIKLKKKEANPSHGTSHSVS
uniref:ATP synthase subunit I n=1 Tax=Desulfobacca acetoxidans TaxID=60893 RepID=A0A7V4LCI0_9BACT